MSKSSHSQTNASAENMNRIVEEYLHCYSAYHQRDWDQLLSSAEIAFKSATVEVIKSSSFELDYEWLSRSL